MKKVKVVIAQLGSPKTPKVSDVRVYLKKFLGDPRVVDINPFLWKIILNLVVLPFRPSKSAKAYERIWDDKTKTFPLVQTTFDFVEKLKVKLESDEVEVEACFLLSYPTPSDAFKVWSEEDPSSRADSVLLLPQFPQYSESTIASVFDNVSESMKSLVNFPHINFIRSFHDSKAFIDNYARLINENIDGADELIVSFHGIPLRRVLDKGDVYYEHCFETFFLLKERVNFDPAHIHFSFQSRFGSEQWLGPATTTVAMDLAKKGRKKIAVVCPSFTVDCLETTDEIGTELGEELSEFGSEVSVVPCLNTDESWCEDYAKYIQTQIYGSEQDKRDLSYTIDKTMIKKNIPKQERTSEPLTPEMKGTLKIVFLSIFLDLIGFSIIFPLFPTLIKYYLEADPNSMLLNFIWGNLESLSVAGADGSLNFGPIALFGSILGALYSLLQFIASPFWGSLSDRIGRKPVMIWSVFGLMISYVLWFFSGSFAVLVAARVIGGIMGGNISTATAIVSDITDKKRRSKGMAFVGIAFALAFTLGPALGGLLSIIDLTKIYPSLEAYGVNPFSVPALLAVLLSAFNLYFIAKNLKETHKPDSKRIARTSNLAKLFKGLPYPGVNKVNFSNFIFVSAFSGMEFTLTFLAVERLGFSSLDNGIMFIFIGFVLAMVQGGFVRRRAHEIGEAKVASMGLITLIPGLLLIAFAYSTWMLYCGLFFLACGSGMIVPTLTSLVSFYSPEENQGEALGIFRSLGALGRVVGPLIIGIVYWRFGSVYPYLVGCLIILIPLLIIRTFPKVSHH